ncbi:RHS repeat-associated core domain-containing protein [Pseudomonas sp. NC26]|uniref:RHS repeat-associated core domain-containing protein n=2 Tax=Pseudomonas putida group TaxID=136845 RepID=A0A7W2L2M5_PSEPU|nr:MULTISPECIES: RHS repeat-associated core domain-containing protein [Pseudomonas]MBA6117187.1 RHS repeat-associated core domain-containing protein [Pseudomonas putida]MCZ9635465.1 RHS repeat-associated core domain-containing protein [Pseudomonas putida]MEC4877081.1 RHS repeat-associated core domain-containing protein [Pseudomonas sp. NC26]QNL90316.1 Uncharacterized protein PPKH_4902 [Pseudomonas putida]
MGEFLSDTDRLGCAPRAYLPYGFTRNSSRTRLAFCGQPHDSVTGLYHLGNGRRAYSPVLHRFLSPDSLSPFGKGGINPYAYCGDNPVNRVDLSGQFWLSNLISGASMASSTVTVLGAVARTSRDVVNRLRGAPTAGVRTRLSNVGYFYSGLAGVASTAFRGVEGGWVGNTLSSQGSQLGLANAAGSAVSGLISNYEAARTVWRQVRSSEVSVGRIAWETTFEVTGARLVAEGASYVWGAVQDLGSRVAASYRAGRTAWRDWQYQPRAPALEMNGIRTG